jgi:hypothetical protein
MTDDETEIARLRRANTELHRRCQANEGAALRLEGMKRTLRLHEAVLAERKATLNLLGIAWTTRGALSRENELTLDQVKALVAVVDRIQRRHFNTEYRLMYSSLEEQVRLRTEASLASMRAACDKNWTEMNEWRNRAQVAERRLLQLGSPLPGEEGRGSG